MKKLDTEVLAELAKKLVLEVRDEAISSCDVLARPSTRNFIATRWRKGGLRPEVAEVVVPDVVDEAICALLRALDDGVLMLSYRADDGRIVNLWEDEELVGWYAGPEGWRDTHAKQRRFPFVRPRRPPERRR